MQRESLVGLPISSSSESEEEVVVEEVSESLPITSYKRGIKRRKVLEF